MQKRSETYKSDIQSRKSRKNKKTTNTIQNTSKTKDCMSNTNPSKANGEKQHKIPRMMTLDYDTGLWHALLVISYIGI